MSTAPAETGWIPSADHFGARLALVRQRMGWGNVSEAALACGQPVSSWAISARTGVDVAWLAGLGQQGVPAEPGAGFINACSSPTQSIRPQHLHVVPERTSTASTTHPVQTPNNTVPATISA